MLSESTPYFFQEVLHILWRSHHCYSSTAQFSPFASGRRIQSVWHGVRPKNEVGIIEFDNSVPVVQNGVKIALASPYSTEHIYGLVVNLSLLVI